MNWMEILQKVFEVCIIPLLGILTTYLIMFIKKKAKELEDTTDNELYKKYIEMLQDTIVRCVIATNQTYVEALKNKNAFDKEAQAEAFRMTYESVMAILTTDAKEYLANVIGDLQTYITRLIEAEVNVNKITTPEE